MRPPPMGLILLTNLQLITMSLIIRTITCEHMAPTISFCGWSHFLVNFGA